MGWALWGALGGGALGRGLALLLVLLAGHLGRRAGVQELRESQTASQPTPEATLPLSVLSTPFLAFYFESCELRHRKTMSDFLYHSY